MFLAKLILLLKIVIIIIYSENVINCDETTELLQNDLLFNVPLLDHYEWEIVTSLVLDSIEDATKYLWKHRIKVNLDGYLGTTMVEGKYIFIISII